jgi:hypothetical protein
LILDARTRALGDERAQVRRRIHTVAEAQRARVLDESLDERSRDRLDDVDAFRGGADLSVVQEAGPRRTRHRHVEVGVLEDYQRVDAAELQVDPFQLARRACGDPRTDGGRSGEGDACDVRIVHERLTDLGPAGHDVDDTRWQMRHRPLDHPQRGQRRQLRRFDHDGVACGERRCDLPHE